MATRTLTIMVLVMTVAGEAFSQPLRMIPRSFQGLWASSLAQCGKVHEGSLSIMATEVKFYAGRGKVLSTRTLTPREIEADLELRAEGEVERRNVRFLLSQDGQQLTDVTSKSKLTRVRCR